MTPQDEAALARVESLARTIKLVELNGEVDGFHGVDQEAGWEAFEADLEAQGVKSITGFGPQFDYHMKTFYENGWAVGHQKKEDGKRILSRDAIRKLVD